MPEAGPGEEVRPEAGQDTPGVVAPPPFIYLGSMLAGGLIYWGWPLEIVPGWRPLWIGIALIALSFVITGLTFREFGRAKTSVSPYEPTEALITTGPFGHSRNPLYVGATVFQLGVAAALNSAWILGLVVPVLVVMNIGVIAREERYLERRFGDAYLEYKSRVRRWI